MIRLSDVKVRLQYRWRVRQRLMVLHFARLHGPTAAGRRFGVSVRTIRRWRVRWRQDALQGLVPRYPRHRGRRITPRVIELIGQARRELEYGAQRTQLWLRRVHDVRVAVGTIQRVFRDIGMPRLRRTRKRVPRQMKLFEKAEPGETVQVDVKFVKIAGRWAFQYTAHALSRAAALSAAASEFEPRLLNRALPSVSLSDPKAAMRQRAGVSVRVRAGRAGPGDPASVHQAPPPAAERQG